jgi:DUF4097 and DUF4098 domain-containing protein YvlB
MKTLFFEEALETAKASLTVKQDVGTLRIQTHEKPLILVEAKVKNVKVEVSREGDNVTVTSRIPQSKKWFNLFGVKTRAELIITVPAECALRLKMAAGSVQVQDVKAPVKASLATGSARFANLGGPIEATVVTGKMTYQGALSADDHRFKAVTGSIRLTLASEPDLTLDAQTVTGAVRCEFPLQNEKRRREFVGGGLQGVLGDGAGSLKITAVTGSVTIEDQRRKTNDQQTVIKEKALA